MAQIYDKKQDSIPMSKITGLLECISHTNLEITYEIFLYLDYRDILSNQLLSKYFYELLSSEFLWRQLVWRDIIPVQFDIEVTAPLFHEQGEESFFRSVIRILRNHDHDTSASSRSMSHVLASMCSRSFEDKPSIDYGSSTQVSSKESSAAPASHIENSVTTTIETGDAEDIRKNLFLVIYRLFRKFPYRLLGYYKRICMGREDYRGALDVIYIDKEKSKLVFQTYSISNDAIESYDSIPFVTDTYNIINNRISCILKPYNNVTPSIESISEKQIQVFFCDVPAFTAHAKFSQVVRYPSPKSGIKHEDLSDEVLSLFSSCTGLVRGMYGPHGMELLHVYYHCIEDANDRNVGSWRLNGLKIIGDPNVPANQLSFSIDVNDKVNVMNAIQEDLRVCLQFGVDHVPNFFDLSTRAPHISCWRRGLGQINRKPREWNPEWRNVNFIVYDHGNPLILPSGAVTFSVIFDDNNDSYRHVIDYMAVDFPISTDQCNWL